MQDKFDFFKDLTAGFFVFSDKFFGEISINSKIIMTVYYSVTIGKFFEAFRSNVVAAYELSECLKRGCYASAVGRMQISES